MVQRDRYGDYWGPSGILTFLTGTRRHRVQIAHFFRGQIGSWRPLGVGLVVGKRLHRIRRRLGPPRALEAIAK